MPKPITSLTDTRIRQTKPKSTPTRIFDGKITGLYIQTQPTGSQNWRLRYKFDGKEKTMSLGKYPIVSLDRARKSATEKLTQIAEGIDPTAKIEPKKITTFTEVCEKFIKWKSDMGRTPATIRKYRECLKNDLSEFGKLDIATVHVLEIIPILEKINQRSNSLSKKNQELITMTLRFAIQRGIRPPNTQPDLSSVIPKNKRTPKFIPSNLTETYKKIEEYPEPIMRAAMMLQFHFFTRAAEMMGARWDEFDMEQNQWQIPANRMKMKRPHVVPLTSQTLEILNELKDLTGDSPYLFPSQTTPRPMVRDSLSKAFRSLKLGIVPHGCRTAASTWLRNSEFSPAAIEAQLSHIESNQIAAAYINSPQNLYLKEREKMMKAWSNHLTN